MSEEDQERRARLRQAQIELLSAMVSLAVMCWYLIPEWKRDQIMARMMMRLEQALRGCARRAGRAAMGLELSGLPGGYEAAYGLSVAAERLQAARKRRGLA